MARIAINGFGRIGRLALRAAWEQQLSLEVVAINDPSGAHTGALLLEYDSNYGPFPGKIESDEGSIRVDGKRVTVFRERDWTKLNWSDLGIDIAGDEPPRGCQAPRGGSKAGPDLCAGEGRRPDCGARGQRRTV